MTRTRFRLSRVMPFAVVAGLALGVVGCGGGDGVTVTTAPKPDGGKGGGDEKGEYRILGGIYPADSPAWFLKFPGAAEDLAKYEADFDKLLASVSLPADGPLEFAPPDGWTRAPGEGQFGFATVVTADGKHKISVTPSKGSVVENVKRWADQVGSPFAAGDLDKMTKPVDAKGVKGLRVDLRGPKRPPPVGVGPMMGKM